MSNKKRPTYDESDQSVNDFRLKKLKMLKVQHYNNHDKTRLEDLSQEVLETNTAEILLSLKLSKTSPIVLNTTPTTAASTYTPINYLNDPSLYPDDEDDKPLDLRTTNGVQQGLTEEGLLLILKQNNVIDIIKHKKCMVCGQNFSGLIELAKHNCERLAQRDFNCPKCKKPYRTNANLHSHLRWCGKSSLKRLNKKKNLSTSSSPSTSSTSSRYSHNARLPSPGLDLSVSPTYRVT